MTKFSKKRGRLSTVGAQAGFIQIIIIVVGALVLLKYVYNIDVVGFLTAGRFRELLDQFYSLGSQGWGKYSEVIIKVWNYVIEFVKNLTSKIK
ncbi:MAG: hypothetical protein WC657_08005 [Candidatus Paceibacterota bacterium]|jgi:hypothetical protein